MVNTEGRYPGRVVEAMAARARGGGAEPRTRDLDANDRLAGRDARRQRVTLRRWRAAWCSSASSHSRVNVR